MPRIWMPRVASSSSLSRPSATDTTRAPSKCSSAITDGIKKLFQYPSWLRTAIASVFYRRGIIETWGQGTLRMAAWTAELGLPKPEILEVPGAVVVRFLRREYAPAQAATKNVTERQRSVLARLAESPVGLAVREIATALGEEESPWRIREDLATLKGLGLVKSTGWGRGARWVQTSR